jgi:ketosteroid isomerase-like protein
MDASFTRQWFLDRFDEAFRANDPLADQKNSEARNVAFVRSLYDHLIAGDTAAFAALLDEDIEGHIFGPASGPICGNWRGRDSFLAAMRKNYALFTEQKPTLENVVAQGDMVVVFAHETGKYVPNNHRYEVRWVQQFLVHDGKVTKFRQYMDGNHPWA